jgi:dTDP-4-dehydrorhamnose reductase
MKNIIIGNGKVSNIIRNESDLIVSHEDIEITNYDSIKKYFSTKNISEYESIINTAAKINLEWCQDNKKDAYHVNTSGVINLLEFCKLYNKKFVQISSGCIFDGNEKEVCEVDQATPSVWYTYTKTWADEIIKNYGYENYLILRPRQLISSKKNNTNMLTKFLSMDAINAIDENNSITCIEDFKEMIQHLLQNNCCGIYNCVNEGYLTPYQIALSLKDKLKPNMIVNKISYKEFLKTLVNKRVNTIMSINKLVQSGYQPRNATVALNWCIENYHE